MTAASSGSKTARRTVEVDELPALGGALVVVSFLLFLPSIVGTTAGAPSSITVMFRSIDKTSPGNSEFSILNL